MLSFLKRLVNPSESDNASCINIEDVVVLDTETGGISEQAPIHSIAAIRVLSGKILFNESISLFIKPKDHKTLSSVDIHGLTKRKLEHEGLAELEVLNLTQTFIQKKTLVGHHIEFDLMLLNKHFKDHNLEPLPENKFICTYHLTKRIERPDPDLTPSYRLEDVCARWKVQSHGRHTAAGDVYSNALLWVKLYKEIKRRKIRFD
jgi:DNA polymerase-3 subunit epsilon